MASEIRSVSSHFGDQWWQLLCLNISLLCTLYLCLGIILLKLPVDTLTPLLLFSEVHSLLAILVTFFVTGVHIIVNFDIFHPITNLFVVLKNNFAFNDVGLGSVDCYRCLVGNSTNIVLLKSSVFIFVIDCRVNLPSFSQTLKVLMPVGQWSLIHVCPLSESIQKILSRRQYLLY